MKAALLPNDKKLVIYRNGGDSLRLVFTQTDTGDPIDMTGRTFTSQVRDRSKGPVLLDMAVTEVDLENGTIDLSWTPEDTASLPTRRARWGVVDDTGVYWVDDYVDLKAQIPQ